MCHQPATRPVATTDVAHPLIMLTAQAATAVAELGSSVGKGALLCGAARVGSCSGSAWRGI
jgi:hypothetical protein